MVETFPDHGGTSVISDSSTNHNQISWSLYSDNKGSFFTYKPITLISFKTFYYIVKEISCNIMNLISKDDNNSIVELNIRQDNSNLHAK